MAVLLLGEVTDGHLSVDATAKALTAAKNLGPVTVLCAGARASDAARDSQAPAGKLPSASMAISSAFAPCATDCARRWVWP